nr:EOG090X0IQO [Eurycercus lamellatus]
MPSYELSLLIRLMSKPELVSSLKRTAETVLDQGGVLRKFISLGTNPLPIRMKAQNSWHREASQFVMKFDAPSSALDTIRDELRRDIDIIKHHLLQQEIESEPLKKTHEHTHIPEYRVQKQPLISYTNKSSHVICPDCAVAYCKF